MFYCFSDLLPDIQEDLSSTASALVAQGKRIFAADESVNIIGKYLQENNLENNEENRRIYREILFTDNIKLSENIIGVILDEETFYQECNDGAPFIEILEQRGLILGVKVDKGVVQLSGTENEVTTQGIDNLLKKCEKLKLYGCEFAKWRCQLKIGKRTPSLLAIMENANIVAQYAAICQSQGIVPIIAAEVLNYGNHDLTRKQKVTEALLSAIYKAMHENYIYLEGTLLMSNMIIPGKRCIKTYRPENIALATVETMRRCVPPAVPGIIFLPGYAPEEDTSVFLTAINKVNLTKPWTLTFSFEKPLKKSVLRIWDSKNSKDILKNSDLLKRFKSNTLKMKEEYESAQTVTNNENLIPLGNE